MPKLRKNRRPDAGSAAPIAGFPWHSQWKVLSGTALIALLTLWAYLPALHGQFIFDDKGLVIDNPLVNAADGLYRIWFTTEPIDYWPLTNTTFWIERRLWGTSPTGYHITNLILHIAAALLIWLIFSKMEIPGAWLAALLFAVHPVNVESVAWIAQRKNTLSMLFFLASIWYWLKADRRMGPLRERALARRWYWLSLLAFTLAMLSKGSVAVLPLLLVLLAWWQRGQIDRSDLVRTAPFFVIAAALTLVNISFQTTAEPIRTAGLVERLLGAGAVVWFYLCKALVPLNLLFVYPQWNIDAADWRWWIPLAAASLVTAVLFWGRRGRFGRPLLFVWLWFCISLVPVMGFTDTYYMKYSLVADHYQYIAIIAPMALAASAWALWFQHSRGARRIAAPTTAVLATAALTILASNQSALYAHPILLYRDTLASDPDSWLTHNNLGRLLAEQGRLGEAIEHFRKTVQLHPNYLSHLNLANALRESGQLQDAIPHYEEALRLKPNLPQLHYEFGIALFKAGRLNDAAEKYQNVIRLKPDDLPAYSALTGTYAQLNRSTDAITSAQKALELARATGQARLAAQIENWLIDYRSKFQIPGDAPPNSPPSR